MIVRDLAGQVFGRLLVVSRADNVGAKVAWLCQCACGSEKIVMATNLLAGTTVSCGCLRSEHQSARIAKRNLRHGHNRSGQESRTHKSWVSMLTRCGNPNHKSFASYGGRGIQVCARWKRFENFLADMGERPDGKTLDRIDVNGNYEPANCRWATPSEQQKNKRGSR